jgi:hypothetical protein
MTRSERSGWPASALTKDSRAKAWTDTSTSSKYNTDSQLFCQYSLPVERREAPSGTARSVLPSRRSPHVRQSNDGANVNGAILGSDGGGLPEGSSLSEEHQKYKNVPAPAGTGSIQYIVHTA